MVLHHEPLYRKVNTRTHGVAHAHGGDFRTIRHGRAFRDDPLAWTSMQSGRRRGLDYTPLFRFLLSRVGDDWADVLAAARPRLDREDPIHWMVSLDPDDTRGFFRAGESSYFSALHVDRAGRLQLTDPALDEHALAPSCRCCTHTFNGKRFTRPFEG